MNSCRDGERRERRETGRDRGRAAVQMTKRVFSPRTLASQRERQRQSELRKKRNRAEEREERSEGEEEGTVKLRGRGLWEGGGYRKSMRAWAEKILGVTLEKWE